MSFREYRDEMYVKSEEMNELVWDYWNAYSDFSTWQFWLILLIFILPLVVLFFTVDPRRIFEVFFFGYTIHFLRTYPSLILERLNFITHSYFIIPVLPFSLNITASLLPVAFLLLYQYTTKYKKNFYIYAFLLSAVFAFVFAPIQKWLGLLSFDKGANYFHLFLIDIAIAYIAYWFTLVLKRLKHKYIKK